MQIRITPCGDMAANLHIQTDHILPAFYHLEAARIVGITGAMPVFAGIFLYYDPAILSFDALKARIEALFFDFTPAPLPAGRIFEIPVCYGGDFGPDLEFVAQNAGITPDEVIALHSGTLYTIRMLGFQPGFPYLSGLPEKLITPRRAEPRLSVAGGSVGIGGNQTGFYTLPSPGGWQIIGRIPVSCFDRRRPDPIPYRAGDRIRFIPITQDEYDRLYRLDQAGGYHFTEIPGGEGR